MIKKIAIVIAILIALPFLVALFITQTYDVERSVTINQPKSLVFDYIKYLKNQNNFSKWAQVDPEMEKRFSGTDATVGFISAWSSDNPDVGVGEQEILNIVDGERIDFELRFMSPFEATEPAYMTTEAISADKTLVKWGFSGHIDYPMNLTFLFIDFETMIGNDLQQGLDNLKVILD